MRIAYKTLGRSASNRLNVWRYLVRLFYCRVEPELLADLFGQRPGNHSPIELLLHKLSSARADLRTAARVAHQIGHGLHERIIRPGPDEMHAVFPVKSFKRHIRSYDGEAARHCLQHTQLRAR